MVDTTAPTLNLPANMTVEATGSTGATVNFSVTATDDIDPNPTVLCAPASGSTFPLGATPVNCSATDASGNTANGSFTVTVEDTTAPTLNLPANMTEEATGSTGAVASFSATASDLV
ncbi:MAG: HYR domain-containing protein, partial [Caldilineaceae bacterium]|nr:HYR domain-containing protein [Caldilineaceae bacterium]